MNTNELASAIYSHWTSDGASVTIRKGSHSRVVTLDKGNKHDCWIWSGRQSANGETKLIARFDLRTENADAHLVGWSL